MFRGMMKQPSIALAFVASFTAALAIAVQLIPPGPVISKIADRALMAGNEVAGEVRPEPQPR